MNINRFDFFRNKTLETKLVVDFISGRLEATGSEEFVRSVYDDFKSEIASKAIVPVPAAQPNKPTEIDAAASPSKTKSGSPKATKRPASDVKVDADLDLHGLEVFFNKFLTKKDAERALIFVVFLRDEKNVAQITRSQVYTCFFALKSSLTLPNIKSLFVNDGTRTKFFKHTETGEIELSQMGENHFSHKLVRAESSET